MGLYVLTAMGQDGAISYEGGRFHRDFSLTRVLRFMAEEGMGKPFKEADAQMEDSQVFLDDNKVGGGCRDQNMLVFYNPKAELTVSAPPRPVVTPKGLKKAIRKQEDAKLPAEQLEALQALFEEEDA